jgi:AraC-like DNA-binding protein
VKRRAPDEGTGHAVTVAATFARAILDFAAHHGHDRAALAARYGLDLEVVDDVEGRIPAPTMLRLWAEIPALLGVTPFGLALAEHSESRALAVFGYLMTSAPTLGESMTRLLRYERLLQSTATGTRIEVHPDHVSLCFRLADRTWAAPPAAVEYGLAAVLRLARATTGVHIVPRGIAFEHPAPPEVEPYERFFGVRPRFGAPRTEICVTPEVLALPFRTADPVLSALLERHAEAALARLPEAAPYADRIRAAIREALEHGGHAALEEVARRVSASPRTVQRLLREEGTTYHAEVDAVREALARTWLADPRRTLHDVAISLGFADQSAFSRAFTRWTGVSPGRFRRGS